MKRVLVFLLCFAAVIPVLAQVKMGSQLPSFALINSKAESFNSKKAFVAGKPLAVIYFSPYCGHCTLLVEEIAEKKSKLKKMNFLLVTSFAPADYNTLIITRGLSNNPNIKVGTDVKGIFATTFGFKQVPAVAVFDRSLRLKKAFEDDVNVVKIMRSAGL